MKNLLLLSSSRAENSDYLVHAKPMIKDHLNGITEVLFIPYAGVSINYQQYTSKVAEALSSENINVIGIEQMGDPIAAVQNAQAILVGGGNTFHLLYQLYQQELIEVIREKVNSGTPYIGWSAGSNIAGSTIKTTNDMPIIEPPSFNALALVDFQLNPHYTDHNPPGHNGETREQRLAEFMVLNPENSIVGIIEGSALKLKNNKLSLTGPHQGYLFKGGEKSVIETGTDLSHLLG